MSAVVEARHLISEVAGPMQAGAQIQEMLTAVGRRTGLGMRRLRGIWNNEARSIRAEELDALRRAAARQRQKREAEDRDEYRSVIARIAFLEDRLAAIDPDFHRASPDQGRPHQGIARREAGPLAGGR